MKKLAPLSLMTVLEGWLLLGGVAGWCWYLVEFGSVFSFISAAALIIFLDNCINLYEHVSLAHLWLKRGRIFWYLLN